MNTPFDACLFRVADLKKTNENDAQTLVVPVYQRPFCWTHKQIEVLIQDLVTHFGRYEADKTCRYSLGTIVCHQRKNLEVLDGQQRLTSIDVLLDVLKKRDAQDPNSQHDAKENPDHPIIRRYDNLCGSELSVDQEIFSSIHVKLDKAVKDGLIFSIAEGVSAFEEFARCIRESVEVLLVILPIDDRNPYEGPAMFEIVNMRGQALRSIDIAKAVLVENLKGAADCERVAFDRLWNGIHSLLGADTQDNVKNIVENMHKELNEKSKDTRNEQCESSADFSEIIAKALNSGPRVPKMRKSIEEESACTQDRRFVVDFENLFVIANEVYRWCKNEDSSTFETLNIRPSPNEGDYRGLHDRIVVGKSVRNIKVKDDEHEQEQECERRKDVWQFMSVFWIAAMVARHADSLLAAPSSSKTPFALLLDTFYAANGYQYSGQYWLLMLVQTAVEEICPDKRFPESIDDFLVGKLSAQNLETRVQDLFKEGFTRGYLRLLLWGLQRFSQPNVTGSMTATVLALGCKLKEHVAIIKTPSELIAAIEKSFELIGADTQLEAWRYTENGVRWKLFFTDWLLWVDGRQFMHKESFTYLRKVLFSSEFANLVETLSGEKLGTSFEFFCSQFKKKVQGQTMRIVSRSQIEHWIAQDTDGLVGKPGLHCFANLALINASENSSNGNKSTSDKSAPWQVGDNPTAKLLWLSAFAKAGAVEQKFLFKKLCSANMDSFWARYIGSFAKHKWTQN